MNVSYETHVFRYRHDGAEWELKIDATDADDARARIGKLAYATYDGVAISQMPLSSAPIGMLSVWCHNLAIRIIAYFARS